MANMHTLVKVIQGCFRFSQGPHCWFKSSITRFLIKIFNYSFTPATATAPTNSTKSMFLGSYQLNYLVIKLVV